MACGTGNPSHAITGKGSTIEFNGKVSAGPPAVGATWTTLAEVSEATFSGLTTDEDDVTNLGSPGGIKETIATISDPGTMDLKGNYTQDASLESLRDIAFPDVDTCRVEAYWWRLTMIRDDLSTDVRVIPGYIKTFQDIATVSPTTKVEFNISVRITGLGTRTITPDAGTFSTSTRGGQASGQPRREAA